MLMAGTLVLSTLITSKNADAINGTLGTKTFEVIETSNESKDTEYYKSDYKSLSELRSAGKSTAAKVLAEGMVLLKNENNALPLAAGSNISLVGVTAYDPVYGGTGSGTISVNDVTNFVDSLNNANFKLNPSLIDAYTSEEWAQYKRGSEGKYGTTTLMIHEAPWAVVDQTTGSSFAQYGDAAIFVVGRVGGEGYDLIGVGGDGIDNGDGLGPDYLGLNANEISVLEGLKDKKAAGEIKKIIVLVNYAGMIEGDFLQDPDIDAALWVGAIGIGGEAVGQVLSGVASPSGRLPDTMWVDNAMNPVNVNFGRWIYEGASQLGVPDKLGTGQYPATTLAGYVVYQEGMYLGYRYTETRYEDLVLGTPNLGDYNYESVVARPFGFGLSYADFELSNMSVKKSNNREYNVTITVTNVSDTYSGKYSVPVYVSKPYGEYAKTNSIQVPSVELLDFGKTQILAPGESETLVIPVDEKYFASYDAHGAKGYVLLDGDYYVAVGGSAHDAVNNVLAAKKENGVTIDESKMIDGTGDSNLVQKFTLDFDKNKYAYSDAVSSLDGVSNVQVTNLFDFADINMYEGRGDNSVNYYSRDNWAAVSLDMENGHASLSMTEQMAQDIYAQLPEQTGKYNNAAGVPEQYRQPIAQDNGEYPSYGVDAGLMLIDMRYDEDGNEIGFTDPIWDTFMDQISWDETVALVSNGFHMTEPIESVAKPQTKDENGPNGFGGWAFRNGYYTGQNGLAYRNAQEQGFIDAEGNVTSEADPDGFEKMTGFPANGILAATFNRDLVAEVGNIIGNDGIWSGSSGLYGIGLNIHRSPYAGRTCEYFSECGTLTGMIGAVECAAIEEKGVHVYNKHCALNDQETNRHGVCTWVNEQTIRELYLRAFEIPIIEGGAYNVMSSFSRFGVQAAPASTALGTDFLRGECGMKGIIVTDAYGDMDGSQDCDPYFEQVYGILVGGSDIPDGSTPKTDGHFDRFKSGYSEMAWAMRLAAKRICYQTTWSNAMNGISSTTEIVRITPWWQSALYTADAIFITLFAAGLVWTFIALYQERKSRNKMKKF